jgi:hypothetical protein
VSPKSVQPHVRNAQSDNRVAVSKEFETESSALSIYSRGQVRFLWAILRLIV